MRRRTFLSPPCTNLLFSCAKGPFFQSSAHKFAVFVRQRAFFMSLAHKLAVFVRQRGLFPFFAHEFAVFVRQKAFSQSSAHKFAIFVRGEGERVGKTDRSAAEDAINTS